MKPAKANPDCECDDCVEHRKTCETCREDYEAARKKWESFVESVVESGGIGLPDEAEVCGCPHGYKKGSCPVCGG